MVNHQLRDQMREERPWKLEKPGKTSLGGGTWRRYRILISGEEGGKRAGREQFQGKGPESERLECICSLGNSGLLWCIVDGVLLPAYIRSWMECWPKYFHELHKDQITYN